MNINQIEASYNEITSMYESGEINKQEYANLLSGLEIEQAVTLNAEELQRKELLNNYITAAITAASLIA
jgi:uncharacterized protein YqgQ